MAHRVPGVSRPAFMVSLITALALAAVGQEPQVHQLNILILDGEGAVNNIKARTAGAPVVQVVDENHKPVSGAAVLFELANDGPGGAFANGAKTLQVFTDSQGRAVATGFHANKVIGKFQISVHASYHGVVSQAAIAQVNVVGATAGTGAAATGGLISAKVLAIVVVSAAAVIGGTVAGIKATSGGSSKTTIGLGSSTVTHP